MNIPQPKATFGDKVLVKSYCPEDKHFESGKVLDAEYHVHNDGTGGWHYRVQLDRKTKSKIWSGIEYGDNSLFLFVSDNYLIRQDNEDN